MPSDHQQPLPQSLNPRRRRHAGSSRRSQARTVGRRVAVVVFAMASIAVLGGSGWAWWKYTSFNDKVVRLNIAAGPSAPPKPKHDIDGVAQNILIVGNDDRSTATNAELAKLGTTRDGGSLNTDTMMIVHVPADGKAATLISLPRDSYVSIPGYGMAKLNSAYPDAFNATSGNHAARQQAGAQLLIRTVQNLTGLTIDHFMQVDLLGFYRISEAIGPIKVNMCRAVQESNSGIDLHKGINYIEGKQALAFVRQRYGYPDGMGDLDRVQRQRYFLTAAFRKIASAGVLLNPAKLSALLSAVQRSISIDSTLNLPNLALQMENLSANNISGETIPTDGFSTTPNGESVVDVNPAQVKTFIARMVSDATPDKGKTVAPSTVSVEVYNAGSGVNNAAHQAAGVLEKAGFKVTSVGDAAASSDTTVIEYPKGMGAQANTLRKYVPGAQVFQDSSVTSVTLLLGSDGLTAKIPSKSSPSASSASASASPAKPSTAPLDAGCIN